MGKKRIEMIRKNISERRKAHQVKYRPKETIAQVSTEEKHGYMPYIQSPINVQKPTYFKLIIKLLLSVSLFIVVKLTVETNSFVSNNFKDKAINAFTEDFPFAQAYLWYEKRFGTPLAFISDQQRFAPEGIGEEALDQFILPVYGQVNSSIDDKAGIYITPTDISEVRAMRDGIVLFKGKDRQTNNKTIIIQHEDMSKSYYSNLSSINIHLYEFVLQNEVIGTVNPKQIQGDFHFSIERNREQIDPLRVIKLDE